MLGFYAHDAQEAIFLSVRYQSSQNDLIDLVPAGWRRYGLRGEHGRGLRDDRGHVLWNDDCSANE